MHVLDYSILSGSLVVKKNTAGSVTITTTPPTTIDSNEPKIVAVGFEVRDVVNNTNIRELIEKKFLSVIV
jgi:hypothetical protein